MFGRFVFLLYLCTMIMMLTILTDRELVMLIIGGVIYVALFVVILQNSRRKVLLLQQRLNKVREMQEAQQATTLQSIKANERRISDLESLIHKLGDENSVLRLELEEKKARLDYNNKVALIESEKRGQAETVIFSSEVYQRVKTLLATGKCLNNSDWQQIEQVVNSVYTNFTERLFSLYPLSEHDYHVCLLTKIRLQPKDIAALTSHSKESVATTRSRLYHKVFGRKGSSKDWDDFVLTL